MAIFKCKMCGGTLEIQNNETVAICEYCGTQQTLPRLDDDRRSNLYDRANHFRRNNDFDKAMSIYEQILNEDNTDAEAYWSLVLCRYGIEYVEDSSSHKRIPTVNRAQFTSIFADENYKSALQYADGAQRAIYEEEAKTIDEIQKGILAISQKEEPFDVFICYKETDNNGRRTPDSVLANDLYHQLIQEGFKVFFARITLEDKLGSAYEPYIFAALNSSKVMVVLGTKPEYFNAVWVKNEWSRYLSLIKNGAKKMLIPAYKDMDPYDLPEEFSHLQAQDMSKLGFMQDLIRGIKKIAQAETSNTTVAKETIVVSSNSNTAPLLERAFMFLEDGDWSSADDYCEKVLDLDPKNAHAYLGKLMAELKVRKQDGLADCAEPFDGNSNCQKAIRFADSALADTLKGYIAHIKTRNENARLDGIYRSAKSAMASANTESDYKEAALLFESVSEYQDSSSLAKECYDKAEIARKDAILAEGKSRMTGGVSNYETAIKLFESVSGWKDADERLYDCRKKIEEINAKAEADRLERERIAEISRMKAEKRAKRNKKIAIITTPIVCAAIAFIIVLNAIIIPNSKYNDAIALMNAEKYAEAISAFEALNDYKDAIEQIKIGKYKQALSLIDKKESAQAAMLFGSIQGYKDSKEQSFKIWSQLAVRESVSAGYDYTVGLKSNGAVVAVGYNYYGQCKVTNWKDIVAISAGYDHTVGLKSDGTVVAVGYNNYGQCKVTDWNDIVAISAGKNHTVGLKSDGTVLAVGFTGYGDVTDWNDIVAISAGGAHAVGLKSDGTVVAVGYNSFGKCKVTNWKDIVAISAGRDHTVGLKSDGTAVAVGDNKYGQCKVTDWNDIVAISAGYDYTVGLKSDGTVLAVGDNEYGQCKVTDWKDIVAISAGSNHTVGLKSDGTVVAVGYNNYGQCKITDWNNIKVPG